MSVTFFEQTTVYDFTIAPPASQPVRAPAPPANSFVLTPVYDFTLTRGPNRRELRTEVRALKRHRARVRAILERIPSASPLRAEFERAASRVFAGRWIARQAGRGRRPDAQRAEKVQFAEEQLAQRPRPTWEQVTQRMNAQFGTEYTRETVRQYVRAARRKRLTAVAA